MAGVLAQVFSPLAWKGSMVADVELPNDYYLRNFRELIQFVDENYAAVLGDEERRFAREFQQLSEPAQRLYIRLLCRSRRSFRLSRLSYPEIETLTQAATELEKKQFVRFNDLTSIDEVLALFTRAELAERFEPELPASARRPQIVDWIVDRHQPTDICAKLLSDDVILSVQFEEIFAVYRLCFFGNLYQDMTEFVLRDLGLTRFESYTIDAETRVYQSRNQLEAHLQYYRCYQEYEITEELTPAGIITLWQALPEVPSGDHHLKRRVERFTNTLARQLERAGEQRRALSLYVSSERPPSRERQARIHHGVGELDDALSLCEAIRRSPLNEEEYEFALQFGARVAKKLGQSWTTIVQPSPEEHTLTLSWQESVESAVRETLATDGKCFYTENTLFNGVFGLVFWDVIFAPLKGVFFNPFQSAPADIHEPEFRQRRQQLIDDRFEALRSMQQLRDIVRKNFESKQGVQNSFVNWRYLQWELVDLALQHIPLKHWKSIFCRLLSDPRNHRNGLPDLIHFPDGGGYNLIEVKGPGDKLQKNQLRWMRFFTDNNIPHQVVHVKRAEPLTR